MFDLMEALQRANSLHAAQEYLQAIDEYTALIAACPGNPVLYARRGYSHFKHESWDAALADGQLTVSMAPCYDEGHFLCGQVRGLPLQLQSAACLPQGS